MVDADEDREADRREPDDERRPRPVDDPAEHVAEVAVGARTGAAAGRRDSRAGGCTAPARCLTPGSTPSRRPFGSWVAITAAKTAMKTRKPRMIRPTTADRWRRTLRSVSRHRPVVRVGSRRSSADERVDDVGCQDAVAHRWPDPRVEEAVRDVDEQVDHDVDEGDEQGEALDDHVVAAGDRLEQRPPDAGQVEHGLGQDRARQQRARAGGR